MTLTIYICSIWAQGIFVFVLARVFERFLKSCTLEATEVSKGAKIRNGYNQVPQLTQDTNGKVTNS